MSDAETLKLDPERSMGNRSPVCAGAPAVNALILADANYHISRMIEPAPLSSRNCEDPSS